MKQKINKIKRIKKRTEKIEFKNFLQLIIPNFYPNCLNKPKRNMPAAPLIVDAKMPGNRVFEWSFLLFEDITVLEKKT